MNLREPEKLKDFQELIGYEFNNIDLLVQALTIPKFGYEMNLPDYNILETLGDAVIKLIFSLKLYNSGIRDSEELTKKKASIENDETLKRIALKYFDLGRYIFELPNQDIEGTNVLADVFEAICGAVFLDSNHNIALIESKIIDKFYEDIDNIIKNTTIFNKNKLIEFLQKKYRVTPVIEVRFKNLGTDDKPEWIAENPKIFEGKHRKELVKLKVNLKSSKFKNKKGAEKDLYLKILHFLEKNY